VPGLYRRLGAPEQGAGVVTIRPLPVAMVGVLQGEEPAHFAGDSTRSRAARAPRCSSPPWRDGRDNRVTVARFQDPGGA
jgi:hypothetical protein